MVMVIIEMCLKGWEENLSINCIGQGEGEKVDLEVG